MYFPGYFKDKKITVMGLGLLGRGLGDVQFLAEEGAELIVTDLKSREELQSSLASLKHFQNISFVLGEHRFEDFRNRDFILKAAGVPLDSLYIAEARKNNIPIEMSTSLFARLTPAMIIGITGTRGKSTVTHLLYEVLQKARETTELEKALRHSSGHLKKPNVFLGGNVKGVSTLQFLKETKEGDIAVLELDSWQLQGFGESKISPHLSIFTTFMKDHMNYYKDDEYSYLADKANIFLYQSDQDVLVVGSQAAPLINTHFKESIQSKVIVADSSLVKDWDILMLGEHNRYNVALVLKAAEELAISEETVREVARTFKGVPGRLEFIREYNGIKIYNDTTSTTPTATQVALMALNTSPIKNIILIMGGADKTLSMTNLIESLPAFCKSVILLPGTGTDKIRSGIKDIKTIEVSTLQEAVSKAFTEAKSGDIVLLSPGFASFGMFQNEYDRGDQFTKIIQSL
jgi:UDP-N-acetylmuramoylalanine--D-glutamate ligase